MKLSFKPHPHHIVLTVIALAFVALSVGLVFSLLQKDTSTHSGNLYYLTSKYGSIDKGSDITYTVRLAPETPVDTVTATLSYDASKLTYKSVSYKDSPFSTQIPAINKAGSLMIQSAKFHGNVTQDSFVASVVFTATESGSPEVKLAGNAALAGIATNPTINGKSGTSTQSMQRAMPWIIGLIVCLVAGIILFLIIRRHQNKLQSNNHKKIQEDTGKPDETA